MGNQEVDEAVVKAVTDGNMSTLNCPEEVYLAERLLGMHPGPNNAVLREQEAKPTPSPSA